MNAPTPSQTMLEPPEDCSIATLCSLNFRAAAAGVVVMPAATAVVIFVQFATGVQHSLVLVVAEVFLRFQASLTACVVALIVFPAAAAVVTCAAVFQKVRSS